ncbi:hypothetical protein GWK08_06210 [Leptobacterium flavescens]|uniref:Uncharacterized protein n=1 Tax=Leptobacterium flavescens TaxID=472055 RepID=A0A6P0UIE8_9FLAO|nr:ABC transporter permease [Leptobacterium flavescens]NER13024.1 hypothetical protein [Leptobacterium flavescens]
MFRNYLKIAWRNLVKNKLSTLINVLGLSIGISACMVILVFTKYESDFDSYHQRSDDIYRVVQHTEYPEETLYWNTTAYPLAEALRNDFPEIDIVTQTAGPASREFSVKNEQGEVTLYEEPYVLFADGYYLETFDAEWLAGDRNTALDNYGSVVLTEYLAKKYFGNDISNYGSVLGKTIMLNSKDPLVVSGVVKNPPGNANQRYNMLVPYEFFKENNPFFTSNWSGNYQGTTFVVLKNEKLKEKLESAIAGWKKKYLKPEDDRRISYFLQPLKEIHTETLYGSIPGGYTMPAGVLRTASLVALFILIIAIVNFVNLITAQSTSRSKEVGIRKVLGGSRFNLIFQFVLENIILISLTLGLSVLMSYFLINELNGFLSIINLKLHFGWEQIGLVLLIGGLTVLLAAIYPALVLSSFKPIPALKNMVVFKKTNGLTLRKSLIVFQFVIVQLFVIASIVVATQMNYFRNQEIGFSSDAVVTTSAPEFNKLEVYRNALLQDKDILKVSFGSGPPMGVNGYSLGTSFRTPEQTVEEGKSAEMKIGDINYLDFYDLELIAGRNFISNKNRFDEFIVNEKLLKAYNWTPQEAIGKRLAINEGEATIVGVVKDFNNHSLQYEITPCIILNWNAYQNNAFIKIADGSSRTLASVEKTWNGIFKNSVYNYEFLDDSMEKEYLVERLIFNGFTILSILAISIGCLGLLGLMSFITLRKTKEIGIRKVLGAGLLDNVTFFSKEFIFLVAIAFIIAVPLVYYAMNMWLQGFSYKVELSLWMFLSGGVITLMIALLSCSFQSVKASLADPVKSLRTE